MQKEESAVQGQLIAQQYGAETSRAATGIAAFTQGSSSPASSREFRENFMLNLLQSKPGAIQRVPQLHPSFPAPNFASQPPFFPLPFPNFFVPNPGMTRFPIGYSPFYPQRTSVCPFVPLRTQSAFAPSGSESVCEQPTELAGNKSHSVILSNGSVSGRAKGKLSGKAYISRNVYKSIVRFLFTCVQKNKEQMTEILKKAEFSDGEIEKCFTKLRSYNDSIRAQSSKKNSQAVVKKIVKESSARTYVLRETLYAMMQNSTTGKLGRISERNKNVYHEVCEYYYDEIVKSIGQSPQTKTFAL